MTGANKGGESGGFPGVALRDRVNTRCSGNA